MVEDKNDVVNWSWSLNYSQITENIYVGSCPVDEKDVRFLINEIPITAVISLQHFSCHDNFGIDDNKIADEWDYNNIKYIRIPMKDFDKNSQVENLSLAISTIHDLINEGHTVYIHCTAGINRSPLVVLCYLIFFHELTDEDALELITFKRPEARPYLDVLWAYRSNISLQYCKEISEKAYINYLDGCEDDIYNWVKAEKEIIRGIIKCIK